uniref:Uncharacterized protein n=1 Tax=Arundo donax TaxID=35708 RepID=A0A0A9BJU8_ARUDO
MPCACPRSKNGEGRGDTPTRAAPRAALTRPVPVPPSFFPQGTEPLGAEVQPRHAQRGQPCRASG